MANYTLITGASKGIGKAIAEEAAARGMNLLLVARSENLLQELAARLSAKNVQVKFFATDLLQADAPEKIFDFAEKNGLNVNMLINNAGMGLLGDFVEHPLQKHLDIMHLNMDACVRMAYVFLKRTGPSWRRYILNVSSTAAFQPIPHTNIYAATKAFILFFSGALRQELKSKNVYVTALCPGGTESEFHIPAGLEQVVEKNSRFMMKADIVAKAGLNGLMKNKGVVIPGLVNKLSAFLSKYGPHDMVIKTAAKIYE